MTDINYTLTFFSDWHCGSGLSGGSESDALVKKTREGLPYVPGKTVKGLLKEAAMDLFEGDPDYNDFIETCFGTRQDNQQKKSAPEVFEKPECQFFYSNIELASLLAQYLIRVPAKNEKKPTEKEKLFRKIQTTSIDEKTGVAKNKTLRTIEVTIPITIVGKISNNLSEDHKYNKKIKDCLRMIKRLGVNRNRGLGRCQFNIIEPEKGGLK